MMHILILEDEIPAYQKLVTHVNTFFTEVVTHDWSRSVADAAPLLRENTYGLILADIQLLDGTSFDLFNQVDTQCPIIFCSAHDDYLFQAFNTNGIAYILKPYSKADFETALNKYQSLFKNGSYQSLDNTTIKALKTALIEEDSQFKKRFVIKKTSGIQLLNASDISVIEASGDFCIVTDQEGKRHTISQSFGTLKEQLNPKKFFKINRSEMVHIDYIETIENHFKNRLLITMKGLKEKVMTSTSITATFRKWLES
jgi:DNA-binding LytR/AlgR family response regulator